VTTDPRFPQWAQLTDAALATELARATGELLVAHRTQLIQRGTTQWILKDSADALAHNFLMDALAVARPGDAILSEEGIDDRARLTAERVWIVDPLDGTNEYGENRADWAVHVALWQDDELSDAAVGMPCIDTVFSTDPAPMLEPRAHGKPRIVTSRMRAPYAAVIVANALDCDAYRLGSAGAKAMSIVMNEADIYVHDGGMYQWDSAAPIAVARAAGLHVSRIDGSPLKYNAADTWLPDLIVCRKEFFEPIMDALWRGED
jgi:3'(2'), 5'-bisphosphate nucleotidase